MHIAKFYPAITSDLRSFRHKIPINNPSKHEQRTKYKLITMHNNAEISYLKCASPRPIYECEAVCFIFVALAVAKICVRSSRLEAIVIDNGVTLTESLSVI